MPVPYGTGRPLVGSSVISGTFVPGGVFSVFGNHTATALLAVVFAGWNATMNAATVAVVGGIGSGSRSTATSIAASGNGSGCVLSGFGEHRPRIHRHR